MFLALLRARIANLRACFALDARKLASSRHERDAGTTDLGAVDIERDTSRKLLDIFLGEACRGAVITRDRAPVAGIDTALHGFVGHGEILRRE